MKNFIEITDTSGEWYLVNVDHVTCMHLKRHPYEKGKYLHQIEVTDRMIEVTEQMFNSVKAKLQ